VDQLLSLKELYEKIREQIEHEDELINHRLTWFLASQGFLFVAFTTLLITDTGNIGDFKLGLLISITGLGSSLSLIAFLSVASAFISLKILRKTWSDSIAPVAPVNRNTVPARGYAFPQVTFKGNWYLSALSVGGGIPLVIMLVWGILFTITLWPLCVLWSSLVLGTTVLATVGLGYWFVKATEDN
jgi:hypothetical protein